MNNVTLVVSSCDKYEDAWYPYFELLKKYWPQHPEKIALITETKQYSTEGLNIKTYNYPENYTWSERLYRTLEAIDTKYIIFSLEDIFLLDYVKQKKIDKCIEWMENDDSIAECRLYGTDASGLQKTDKYDGFYIAGEDVGYRVDCQAAIWDKKVLMSLIDMSETPWQFEKNASIRSKACDKTFLWYCVEDIQDVEKMIFPYKYVAELGYGIAWGKWLWNNKELFKKNNIKNVKYNKLGTVSKKSAQFRFNHLYNKNPSNFDKIIRKIWKLLLIFSKLKSNILTLGFKKGILVSWSKR